MAAPKSTSRSAGRSWWVLIAIACTFSTPSRFPIIEARKKRDVAPFSRDGETYFIHEVDNSRLARVLRTTGCPSPGRIFVHRCRRESRSFRFSSSIENRKPSPSTILVPRRQSRVSKFNIFIYRGVGSKLGWPGIDKTERENVSRITEQSFQAKRTRTRVYLCVRKLCHFFFRYASDLIFNFHRVTGQCFVADRRPETKILFTKKIANTTSPSKGSFRC